MRRKGATTDSVIAAMAGRQHGVVSTVQLAAAGICVDSVLRRARIGRLHRIYRGVYAVGHRALSDEGRWMAAVLACGDGAVLSHRSAAALWKLLPTAPGAADVVVLGGGGRRKRPGIRLHRTRLLNAADITRRMGIPVTTPARTVADLRRILPAPQVRRAIREAGVVGLDIGGDVEADRTRSELEQSFLRLCRRHRLPLPMVNAWIGELMVDFLWHERRLIVETDGYRYHRGRQAFEDDRARDVELRLLGYEVVRLTYRQVLEDAQRVADALRRLLTQTARGRPGP